MRPRPRAAAAPSRSGPAEERAAASSSTSGPPSEWSCCRPCSPPSGAPPHGSMLDALPLSQATSLVVAARECHSTRYRLRLLPHRGHRTPVGEDGDTNAAGRSSKPQPEHRTVRTVTLVRTLMGTRTVRLERRTVIASCLTSAPVARARCRLPSWTLGRSDHLAAPSTPHELRTHWSSSTWPRSVSFSSGCLLKCTDG